MNKLEKILKEKRVLNNESEKDMLKHIGIVYVTFKRFMKNPEIARITTIKKISDYAGLNNLETVKLAKEREGL